MLRVVYNLAIADGKAETNPVTSRLFFRETNQRVRYLTDDEEQRLRDKIGEDNWPKVAFALATGFRQANQFSTTWDDVNFDAGTIRAPRSKSGRDYYVPMNDELRALLRALPSRLRGKYVFPSESGETALDAKNFLHRVFTPALEKARIEGFRWHDLRHTFASRLVMAGVDLRTVQELMGHQSIAMTLRYSHLSPAHKLDAVQRLARPRNADATATATATTTETPKAAQTGGGEVVDLPQENDGRCWDRTSDPRLVRPMLSR
jgi:integrase